LGASDKLVVPLVWDMPSLTAISLTLKRASHSLKCAISLGLKWTILPFFRDMIKTSMQRERTLIIAKQDVQIRGKKYARYP